jgi:hypothetical protein
MKSFVCGGIIFSLVAGALPAHASVVTFNFEARLAGPVSQSGDISNLDAYPFEVNSGAHIIDGSFSYDTSASPFAGLGNYFPTALSFTVGSIAFSTTTLAEVNITDFAFDAFNTNALFNSLSASHHAIQSHFSVDLQGPSTIFSSLALPSSLNLSDFTSQRSFTLTETDNSGPFGFPIGTYTIPFQVTELEQVSTPLPAALPLFAGGLGALGLLGWCRKKKAARAASARHN